MAGPASLRDVARAAGVAASTASLALRDDVRVAPATRERVAAAAQRLGYRPRPELAALAAKQFVSSTRRKHPTLCLIAPRQEGWLRSQRPAFIQVAAQHGYDVVTLHRERAEDHDAMRRRILATGCLGLAVCHHDAEEAGPYEGWHPFPIVFIGPNRPGTPCHAVHGDPFAACLQVWNEVIRRGWRRIGACLLVHEPAMRDDLERLAASLLAQERWLAPRERLPFFRFSGLREGDPALLAWAERHEPEALIAFNAWAPGILARAGRALPFAGLVISPSTRLGDGRRPCGLLNLGTEVLRRGAEHLIASIRFNQRAAPPLREVVRIQAPWQEGDSLPFRQ